jgi:seryl-tRNA synthetase
MLDIRLIRSDADAVSTALARRGDVAGDAIDQVLALDAQWREITSALEELRAEQNRFNKGRTGAPTPEEREQMAALAARGRSLTDDETSVRADLDALLWGLPNTPFDDTPVRPGVPGSITWRWQAQWLTWSAVPRCRGRASHTCAETW